MVLPGGGTIPFEGGMMAGGRQHNFRGGSIPTEGGFLLYESGATTPGHRNIFSDMQGVAICFLRMMT